MRNMGVSDAGKFFSQSFEYYNDLNSYIIIFIMSIMLYYVYYVLARYEKILAN